MISFTPNPERVVNGETLKVKLEIDGMINNKTYKGNYFNVVIKKNGGTLGTVTLYPLRFNGNPLEWEINPYSYGSEGTFTANCIFQGSSSVLTSTTFIVEPDCVKQNNVNLCNNLTTYEQALKHKQNYVKKQEVPIDYTGGCQIQKSGGLTNQIENNSVIKTHSAKSAQSIQSTQSEELSKSSKVQRACRDC